MILREEKQRTTASTEVFIARQVLGSNVDESEIRRNILEENMHNRGKGLNSHERADLLDVVMTVCIPLTRDLS